MQPHVSCFTLRAMRLASRDLSVSELQLHSPCSLRFLRPPSSSSRSSCLIRVPAPSNGGSKIRLLSAQSSLRQRSPCAAPVSSPLLHSQPPPAARGARPRSAALGVYLAVSLFTSQSMPSMRPSPVSAEQPMICHSRSRRSVSPRPSETWAGVSRPACSGRSCLFASTRRRADLSSCVCQLRPFRTAVHGPQDAELQHPVWSPYRPTP